MVPARDDACHELRLDAERRRHFARIENAETPARAGADVEQAVSARECGDDQIDGPLDLRNRGADGGRDLRVLVVDELKDLACRHRAQVPGARITRLGGSLHHAPQARRIARRAAPMAGSS